MTIPRRQRMLGITALACALFLLADRLIFSPCAAAYRMRREQIVNLEQELARAQDALDMKPRWQSRLAEFSVQNLPEDSSKAEHTVLSELRLWASEAELDLETVRPRRVVQKESPEVLDVRLTAHGNMGAVAKFLYTMETAPMPIVIQKTDLAAGKANPGELSVTLQFQVLMQPSAKEGSKS